MGMSLLPLSHKERKGASNEKHKEPEVGAFEETLPKQHSKDDCVDAVAAMVEQLTKWR